MAPFNVMMRDTLASAQVECCKCHHDFHLMDYSQTNHLTKTRRVRCRCTHIVCAKCSVEMGKMVKVPAKIDLSVTGLRQDRQLAIRLCHRCGTAERIEATEDHSVLGVRHPKGTSTVTSFSVKFNENKCVSCQHKGCKHCACFLEASEEDFESKPKLSRMDSGSSIASRFSMSSIRSLGQKATSTAKSLAHRFLSSKKYGTETPTTLPREDSMQPAELLEDWTIVDSPAKQVSAPVRAKSLRPEVLMPPPKEDDMPPPNPIAPITVEDWDVISSSDAPPNLHRSNAVRKQRDSLGEGDYTDGM
jgi:hypothetical protein